MDPNHPVYSITPPRDTTNPPNTTPASATANQEEEYSMEKNNHFWRNLLIVLAILFILTVLVFVFVKPAIDRYVAKNDNIVALVEAQSKKIDELEAAQAAIITAPVAPAAVAPVAPVAPVASTTLVAPVAPAAVYGNDQYLPVFKGRTDRETINFNDNWPTFSPNDQIVWSDNSFHMSEGFWTIQQDGVISGDIDVNRVNDNDDHLYDSDENTFLVTPVKAGDRVYVPYWKAWFTNYYDKDVVVSSVYAQFPTWTRQWSPIN